MDELVLYHYSNERFSIKRNSNKFSFHSIEAWRTIKYLKDKDREGFHYRGEGVVNFKPIFGRRL